MFEAGTQEEEGGEVERLPDEPKRGSKGTAQETRHETGKVRAKFC